jgi:hypothetical protein
MSRIRTPVGRYPEQPIILSFVNLSVVCCETKFKDLYNLEKCFCSLTLYKGERGQKSSRPVNKKFIQENMAIKIIEF